MPLSFAFSALLAIVIHGMGHMLGALAVGVRFCRVRHTATGFRLITGGAYPSYRAEAIVALSGPLANLVTALAVAPHPAANECFVPLSLYLAILNLLPMRGFDGGTILQCLLCAGHPPLPSLLPHRADRVIDASSALFLFLLWVSSVYLLLRRESALSLYTFCLQLFRSVFVDGRSHGRADF